VRDARDSNKKMKNFHPDNQNRMKASSMLIMIMKLQRSDQFRIGSKLIKYGVKRT
jgi:hypothetical protein